MSLSTSLCHELQSYYAHFTNRDLRQRIAKWLFLVWNRKHAVAEGIETRSSQTETLTILTCFLPITNKMSIGEVEWAGTCTPFHTRASEGTPNTSRTAGLPAFPLCGLPFCICLVVRINLSFHSSVIQRVPDAKSCPGSFSPLEFSGGKPTSQTINAGAWLCLSIEAAEWTTKCFLIHGEF